MTARRAAAGAMAALALGAAAPAAAVEVQRVVSPGGIEAWLVEERTVPMLALRFAFRGGAALDPGGKEGLATLVSGLLNEGAGDLRRARPSRRRSTTTPCACRSMPAAIRSPAACAPSPNGARPRSTCWRWR